MDREEDLIQDYAHTRRAKGLRDHSEIEGALRTVITVPLTLRVEEEESQQGKPQQYRHPREAKTLSLDLGSQGHLCFCIV